MLSEDENATKLDAGKDVPLSSFFAINLTIFVVGLTLVMWWGHSLSTGEPFDSNRRMIGYWVMHCGVAYLLFKGFRDMRRLPFGAIGELRITPLKALVVIGLLGGFTFLSMWLLELFRISDAIDAG